MMLWARQWLAQNAPRFGHYGIVRLIQEVWAIPGRIKLTDKGVQSVPLRRVLRLSPTAGQRSPRGRLTVESKRGFLAEILAAVPRHGHVPGSLVPNPSLVMAVQGPLARSASDLELALNVISGPIPGEDVAWRLAIPPARHATLAAFRVAVLPRPAWLPIEAEIAAALDELATWLGQFGATVAEAQLEGFDLRAHEEVYSSLLNAIIFSDRDDDARTHMAQALQHSPDPIANKREESFFPRVAQRVVSHQWSGF